MTKVSINDLELILNGAKAIQNGEHFQREIEKLRESGKKELPMEGVYEMAGIFGIQSEAVDKFMQLRFPSKEQQLKSLGEIGGEPSDGVLGNLYAYTFLRDLKSHFPNERFEKTEGNACFRINKEREKIEIVKGLFKDKKKTKTLIQEVIDVNLISCRNSGGYASFIIYDPSFTEACKTSLINLNKQFGRIIKKIKIEYCYNPHLTDD